MVSLKLESNDAAKSLDDAINRSMRGNLVFHNVPEEKDENPEATKALLANILADHFNKDQNDVMYDIVRAHRSAAKPDSNKCRPIFVKFAREDVAEGINIDLSRRENKTKSGVYFKCTKQYIKALQDRRNDALVKRRELLDDNSIIKGFVEYPAKLIVMFAGQSKYSKHSEY